jgi:putative NADH-flavin reductase
MKLLIIGATRGIGKCLVQQALEQGHETTALVRSKAGLNLGHERLHVITGDILDPESVRQAVVGQEAVCVIIGIGPTRKPVSVFSDGARNIIEAMNDSARCMLVCITGIGAGDSKGHGGFFYDKIINPLLLKTIYEDKNRQEALVRKSGLDWVIVRPGLLTNGPCTGRYRILTDLQGVTAGKISREDVAHFILEAISNKQHFGQTPLITY